MSQGLNFLGSTNHGGLFLRKQPRETDRQNTKCIDARVFRLPYPRPMGYRINPDKCAVDSAYTFKRDRDRETEKIHY